MAKYKLIRTTILSACLTHAQLGIAQPQQEPSTPQSFTAAGPTHESLCHADTAQSLGGESFDYKSITFEKVLEVEPLTPGFAILEGPLWVGDALLMSHIGASAGDEPSAADLVALRGNRLEVINANYGSNGLALDPAGAVVAGRHADGTITRVVDGAVLAKGYKGARFNSPNDLVFSAGGDLYFTDPNWQAPEPHPQAAGRAYHVSPSGKIKPFGKGIDKPNGVMLSLDQQVLYLGGTNGLYRFELNSNGEVVDKPKRVQAQLIVSGVDGLTLDCAGNLFVTAEGMVHVLAANGEEQLASYEIPGLTNLAFGGKDGMTIYATTLGKRPQVWSARSKIPGLPF